MLSLLIEEYTDDVVVLENDKGFYPTYYCGTVVMKEWEKNVRVDMLFCSSPHMLTPHARIGDGEMGTRCKYCLCIF